MNSAEALASGQDVIVKPNGDCELAGVSLPGLPEGMLLVGFREANEGEFAFHDGFAKQWPKGFNGLIVKTAPGFDFFYDILYGRYVPRKLYTRPKHIAVHFVINNSSEEDAVRNLKKFPGFDFITE